MNSILFQLREFKADSKVFLSKLLHFNSSEEDVDDTLIDFLYKIVEVISDCVDHKPFTNEVQDNEFLFDIDETNYQHYRSIKCLKCNVSKKQKSHFEKFHSF